MPDREWLARYRSILVLSGGVLVVVLSLVDHGCNLTGFGECPIPENTRPEKTLWDWLQLLVVPAVLAGAGLWFSNTQKRTELEIASQQKLTELGIAEQRAQDDILQTYLDQIADLLLNHDPRSSQHAQMVRDIARVRTLTTLRRLDKNRRNLLIRFLWDAGLVNKDASQSIIDFRRANFDDADLRGIKFTWLQLERANFHRAQLQGAQFYQACLEHAFFEDAQLQGAFLQAVQLQNAIFHGAQLQGAILQAAQLQKAILEGAQLQKAILEGAQLQGAYLQGAQLQGADLQGAQLQGAYFDGARLDNANLQGSDITADQLAEAASYKDAKLPDHLLNNSNPLQVSTKE